MRTRAWWMSLGLAAAAAACGDQPTEVVAERGVEAGPGTVALATSSTEDGLSITTDKDDYAPGDTVWFTGAGWPAGDTLDIVLVDEPLTHAPHEWWVPVDENGGFRDSTYVVDIGDLGVTFTLTATSRATGRSLTVVFTDGTVKPTPAPTGVRFDVTWTEYTSSTQCSGTVNAGPTTVTADNNSPNLSPNQNRALKLEAAATAKDAPNGPFVAWTSASSFAILDAPTNRIICIAGFSGAARTYTATYKAPNLTIAKQAIGAFQVGENATYQLTVSNASGANIVATSGTITVTDNLPGHLDFVSGGDGTNWTCSAQGQKVECTTAGTIAPGTSAPTIMLLVAVTGQNVTNTAKVEGGGEPLGNAGNNEVSLTTSVLAASAKKLAFTSPLPSFTADKNVCSPLITVQTQTTNGLPVSPSSALTVNLSSSSAGGKFFSDAGCITQITTRSILSTGNSTSFYYKDSVCGSPVLTAAGGSLTSATQTESITGAGCANQPPTVDAEDGAEPNAYSGDEGSAISLVGGASDPDGDAVTTTWSVSDETICTIAAPGSLNTTVACTDNGTYTLTLSATDGTIVTPVTSTATLAVSNVAPTATFSAPASVNEVSAIALSLTNPDDASSVDELAGFEYAFDCGDGAGYGAFSGTATASCSTDDNGTRAVKGKIKDKDSGESEYTASVTVVNVPPTATFNAPASVNEASPINLSLTNADDISPVDKAAGFEYAFDCGDGDGYSAFSSTSTASCATDDNGSRTVKGKVRDKDGGATEYTASVTIANVPPTATFNAPGSVNEGSAIALSLTNADDVSPVDKAAGFEYAFDCGDGAGYGAYSGTSTASCPTADNGTRTVKGKIKDKDSGESEYTKSVTILNVAPTVGPITITPNVVAVNNSVSLSSPFSDLGTADTHTGVIDWDDGSTSNAAITESNGSGTATGSHTYTTANVYTVKVTLTDDDGGSGYAIYEYVVVYDPAAGFVTGGGWINSPEGAYKPDLSLFGKANFGFVSKYQKGASTPSGNTEFQFHAGGLNFSSTVYEWLVVQGNSKATYKGSGTVNGASGYGFLLSVIDGGSSGDRFRIKIWNKTSGVVIYDNQVSGSTGDDADPVTTIANGSIVIHTGKK